MPTINITECPAIKLNGDFFKQNVVIPAPTRHITSQTRAKLTVKGTFMKVMEEHDIITTNKFTPVNPGEFASTLKDIYMEYMSEHDLPYNAKDKINTVLPDEGSHIHTEDANLIYCEGVLIQITRLVVQSIYDLLSDERTHMYVENPFSPGETKWCNVKQTHEPREHGVEDMTIFAYDVDALKLDGVYFNDPIIFPTPNTGQMSQSIARKITRDTFDEVLEIVGISKFSTAPYQDFEKTGTTGLHAEIYNTICESFSEHTNLSERDKKNTVRDKLKSIFPPKEVMREHPNTLHSVDSLVHIIRMILQTWFDKISKRKSHMQVADPFNVSEHKWKEEL